MKSVIIFAGTAEGRTLSEYLSVRRIRVTACTATEYGGTLLKENAYLKVHAGRMDRGQMGALIREAGQTLVVDATHPYAAAVSENVRLACQDTGAEYIRLIRESVDAGQEGVTVVSSVEEAAQYLSGTSGNILTTTGSKELAKYTAIPNYEERVFARVLSTAEVALACEKLGFRGKHLICMQGPFSEELNTALLRQFDCRYLVTKETGKAGGFEEKLRAAAKAGAQVVLVGRPPEQEGHSYQKVLDILAGHFPENHIGKIPPEETLEAAAGTNQALLRRVVTLTGIGMGTPSGMTLEAARAIEEADLLIGARRMLEAAGSAGKAVCCEYDAGKIADYIAVHPEYRRTAVLLSGDIGFYSGAKKLYEALAGSGYEIRSICGISSVVYLCGKLQTAWEDVCLKSVHGRAANLIGAVRSHAKTFAILGTANRIGELCRELQEYGLSHVRVHIGERLGYADEKITSGSPKELENGNYDSLCAALIENPSFAGGVPAYLEDEAFLRGKAPMTKSEVRSLSVARLRLTKDAVIYDVGAGTGSVSVEMALRAADGTVYAVERKEEACALIEENKRRFGTPNVRVVHGPAPEALADLPAPTHAFLGGSGGNLREIMECLLAKNPGIRMVVNTVTLETIGEVMDCLKTLPVREEEILSVTAAKSRSLGAYHLMTGQNPIYIITCQGERT